MPSMLQLGRPALFLQRNERRQEAGLDPLTYFVVAIQGGT